MNPLDDHASRRKFLKGTLLTGSGLAVANFGTLFNSAAATTASQRRGKRCILLWMNGGASQIDTFDMKPGRPTAGPFRPIGTNVDGIRICEYLPKMARLADNLAIIRSMRTQSPGHSDGIYQMHTCYKQSERTPHPELGAVISKYCGNADADLPSFVRLGPTGNAGAGYLGPDYAPFSINLEHLFGKICADRDTRILSIPDMRIFLLIVPNAPLAVYLKFIGKPRVITPVCLNNTHIRAR